LNLNVDQTVAGLSGSIAGTGSATINIASTKTLTSNQSGNTQFDGVIAGSGALTKNGAGILTLTGANTYSGLTLVDGGGASSTLNAFGTNSSSGATTVQGVGTLVLGSGTNGGLASGTLTLNTGTIKSSDANSRTLSNAIAFNAGTTTFGTATTGDLTLNGAATLAGSSNSPTWTANGNVTFAGNVTGGNSANTLTINGTGSVTLSGTNNYTDATLVDGGTLKVVGSNSASGTTTVQNSGTLVLGGGTLASGTLTLNTATVKSSDSTARSLTNALTFNSATTTFGAAGTGALTFGGAITLASGTPTLSTVSNVTLNGNIGSTTNGLTKSGAGTLVLNGTNSYSGATQISAGALQAIDGTGLPSVSILQLRGGVFQSSGTFARTLGTASGNVNWSTSSGGFAANGGILNIQLNAGTGTLNWGTTNSFVTTGQTLIFGSSTADNLVDFQNGINLGTTVSNTDRTIQVNDNATSSADVARISGVISSTGTNNGIVKTGAGILELTRANTYGGTTSVNAGTLLVTNTTGSGTGSGPVSTLADSGATLAGGTTNGVGGISGTVTINSGSNLSPGTSGNGSGTTAILKTGALTLSSTSNFNIDLNSTTAGSAYDQVISAGAIGVNGNLVITAGGSLAASNKFFILDNSTATSNSGTFSGLANGGFITASNNGDIFQINYFDNAGDGSNGNDISLTLTAIPEPSTWVGAVLTLGVIGLSQQRRFARAMGKRAR
jgi:autotransporter-associated beta strand protein